MSLEELNNFLEKASLATYAGNGERVKSEKKGFYELEYKEGDFYYRDSFAGYLSSHGQEVVWYKEEPVWMCSYAGGMCGSKSDDSKFAHETFEFLKSALRAGEKDGKFQPRGPQDFTDGDFAYRNDWSGDIKEFRGEENIVYNGEVVFTHSYFGGMLRNGRE